MTGPRQPAGTPTGGQFAVHAGSAPDLDLDTATAAAANAVPVEDELSGRGAFARRLIHRSAGWGSEHEQIARRWAREQAQHWQTLVDCCLASHDPDPISALNDSGIELRPVSVDEIEPGDIVAVVRMSDNETSLRWSHVVEAHEPESDEMPLFDVVVFDGTDIRSAYATSAGWSRQSSSLRRVHRPSQDRR